MRNAAVGAAAMMLFSTPIQVGEAWARSSLPPIDKADTERCTLATLDKFAQTRAKFSAEAGAGDLGKEGFVDIRDCDFSNLDLSSKIFSGVIMERANLNGARVVGTEMSRADARDAQLKGVNFSDTNCYASNFDGADLEGAQFENSILSSASFGKSAETGKWANLKDTKFEGALVSSSDVKRICANPTLTEETKDYELGC